MGLPRKRTPRGSTRRRVARWSALAMGVILPAVGCQVEYGGMTLPSGAVHARRRPVFPVRTGLPLGEHPGGDAAGTDAGDGDRAAAGGRDPAAMGARAGRPAERRSSDGRQRGADPDGPPGPCRAVRSRWGRAPARASAGPGPDAGPGVGPGGAPAPGGPRPAMCPPPGPSLQLIVPRSDDGRPPTGRPSPPTPTAGDPGRPRSRPARIAEGSRPPSDSSRALGPASPGD